MADSANKIRVKCWNCGATNQIDPRGEVEFKESQRWHCTFCAHQNRMPEGTIDDIRANPVSSSPPRDLKYTDAHICNEAKLFGMLRHIGNSCLLEPATVFVSRAGELQSFADTPALVAAQAYALGEAYMAVIASLKHRGEELDEGRVRTLVDGQLSKWTETDGRDLPKVLTNGKSYLNSFRDGALVWRGFQSLLVAQLTGMWTTFETLATDLWVCAVNAHPQKLAKLDGQKNRIGRLAKRVSTEFDAEPSRTKSQDGVVSREAIERVSKGTFDLRSQMGDLLKERLSFRTLSGIRVAYSRAFKDHTRDLDTVLADRALDTLNCVRNVLVHTAGKIDYEYRRQTKGLANAPPGEIGERLELNGAVSTSLIHPVIKLSVGLIRAVDMWLTRETKK